MQVLKYVFVGLVCWGCADAGDAPVTPDDGADVMIGDATDAGPDEDTNSPADTGEGEDTATPGGECEGKPDGTPCEDGDICSVDDVCTNGQCGGEPRDCNDGDPCTTGTCDAEAGCVYAPAEDGTPCVANCFAVASCLTGACTPNTDTAIV